MADLAQTPANVLAATDAKTEVVTFGATVVAGDALYRDAEDDDKYKLARANATGTAAIDGIALCGGADGQPGVIAKPASGGSIDLGGTLTVGETYVLSAATAGKFAPIGDLASTNYPVIAGTATTASNLKFGYNDAGVAKP